MHENDIAESATTESDQEWFWMLVSYMKVRTLAVWLYHHPETRYEDFELVWPTLFDRMLSQATRTTLQSLAQLTVSKN